MKVGYVIRYSWSSVWHRSDLIFSSLNMFSVAISMLILVSLSGMLKGFKNYSESILNKLPLRIEIFKSKEALFQDLTALEKEIQKIPGVFYIAKRTPTYIPFISATGKIITPQGSTMRPEEPFELRDIYGKQIHILSKKQLNSKFDEIGFIVSFHLLKKLEYLPAKAKAKDPKIWKQLPKKVKIQLTDTVNSSTIKLEVPIIGVIEDVSRGEYIMSEDFYTIVLCWQHPFRYLLKDRHGKPLDTPTAQIIKAYYVLTPEQVEFLEEHSELLDEWSEDSSLFIDQESWEGENGFEERLSITPEEEGQVLSLEILQKFDQQLRSQEIFKNLGKYHLEKKAPELKSWKDFPPIQYPHQYMQAAVYVKDRKYIRPTLEKLRIMGLFASSSLERYLKTFERQEKFYMGAVGIIFGLILFLSGTVLFSTFYTSVQRKRQQIGILKASGASNSLIRKMFYTEAMIIAGIGCLPGVIGGIELGKILTFWINKFAQLELPLKFSLPMEYIASIILAIFLFCWIAIFVPAWIASRIDPVQAIRNQ